MQHSGSTTFYASNSFHVQFRIIYLIKIIFLFCLWVPYLLSDLTAIKVSFVNFKSNLSVLPKRYENNILSSDTMQVWVYLYTFFLLLDHFLIHFMLDKTFISCFPTKISLVTFNKPVHSVIHRICFIPILFHFISHSIVFPTSLSNDISENPGPQHSNHFDRVSPYFHSVTGILIP